MHIQEHKLQIDHGRVAFISDTHILLDSCHDQDKVSKISKIVNDPSYSAVFLVGDIFECWKYGAFRWNAGDTFSKFQNALEMYPEIKNILSNKKVYFFHGNHDYCLVQHPVEFNVYTQIVLNEKILITHGNDADNYNNAVLALPRSRWLVIFDWLTDRVYTLLRLDKIKTDGVLSNLVFTATDRDDIYYKWANAQPYSAVVMGHTHRARNIELSNVQYVNIGSGIDAFEYVVYDIDSKQFTNYQINY